MLNCEGLRREPRGSLVLRGHCAGTFASVASEVVRDGERVAADDPMEADGGDVLVVYDASLSCRQEVRSVPGYW